MRGAGLKGVAVLADSDAELRHFMLQRLLRRGAFDVEAFSFGYASEYNLIEQLQDRKVKVIVTLGERALRQTQGTSNHLRWRGRTVEHQHLKHIWVVPTYQPSDLLPRRGSDARGAFELENPTRLHGAWVRDLHHALDVAEHGFTRRERRHIADPPLAEFEKFVLEYEDALRADPQTPLSFDIETPYKQKNQDEGEFEEADYDPNQTIIRISFAFRVGYAVSVVYDPTRLPLIRRLLASAGRKIVWNGSTFDVPLLEADGSHVGGRIEDWMDGWHVFQSDRPKGLEAVSADCTDFLPWKHLSAAEPGLYSCIDADAALENAVTIEGWLRKAGMYEAFERHSVRLMPILYRAGLRGNLIDRERQEALKTELDQLKAQLSAEAQTMVPLEIRPRELRKTLPEVLEGTPRDGGGPWPSFEPQPMETATGTDGSLWEIKWEPEELKVCTACGQFASNKSEHYKGTSDLKCECGHGFTVHWHEQTKPDGEILRGRCTVEGCTCQTYADSGKLLRTKNPCKEAGGVIESRPAWVPRFYEVKPFNPNSPDQIKDYIRWAGHPMGQDARDSSRETADAKHLKDLDKRFGKKHPIYKTTLTFHQVSKTRGTYCPQPDAQGLIHTTYKNNTSTWRLASANLNMQNWGKREQNQFAKKARKTIIARPGHKLLQIDSASVEAVMLGWFMRDLDYMERASSGIHAWLTAMELGLEFTKENITLIKEQHKKEYDAFKIANHMTNYGGGPAVLFASGPEVFGSKARAAEVQQRIYELLPALREFHHEVRVRAQKETYLQNPWGHRHYFYDVFTTDPRTGERRDGKDSKRCVAYLPQSSNGCFQRDNLLLVAASPIEGPTYTDIEQVMRDWDVLLPAMKAGETWERYMPANLSVHDSGCLDLPATLVERCAFEVLVPIFTRPIPEMRGLQIGAELEVGDNWGDMESLKKIVIPRDTLAKAA